jgi:DNA integrity scanning protein DisA with diadenylate cyclase activity
MSLGCRVSVDQRRRGTQGKANKENGPHAAIIVAGAGACRRISSFSLVLSNFALCLAVRYDKTFFSSGTRTTFAREKNATLMALPTQTSVLLKAARTLLDELAADAVLLLTETDLDWSEVLEILPADKLLVSAKDAILHQELQTYRNLRVLDIDPGPTPTQEQMSVALLEAVATDKLKSGANVIALYNGIGIEGGQPEHIDSISIIHLGEHLERLTAADLRKLDTQVPLETLRAVVELATEIGQEGREGKPVGTMFVVGDTDKVLTMCRPLNFNPFRGYSRKERDVRDRKVREQIKDIAQLEGAIIVRRDGVAEAACMYVDAPAPQETVAVSKGWGTRHISAAAITKKTKAIAVVISQSSGRVVIFQNGMVMLQIEPFARPMIFQRFRMEHSGDSDEAPAGT